MHWMSLLSLAGLAGASPVQSPRPQDAAPRVLHYAATVQRKSVANPSAHKDSLVPGVLGVTGLTIPLYVGSQRQQVPVELDTGSWLTWISAKYFNVNESSTATKLPTAFSINYPESNISGWHWNDTFADTPDGDDSVYIGFGLGVEGTEYDTYGDSGLLGLCQNPVPENEYVGQLKAAGYIESRSFSFWLADENRGSVTFGGVDLSKLASNFTKLPLGNICSIYVHGINATLDNQEVQFARGNSISCLLDTGTYQTYLPDEVFISLAKAFGAVYTNNNTEALANNMANDYWSIKYQGGGTIKYESCGYVFEIPFWRYLADANFDSFMAEPRTGVWYNLNLFGQAGGCTLGMDSVFMEYNIAFDFDNNNVGFAKNNHHIVNDDQVPASLSAIGSDGIAGTFAPSTELATLGTELTVYSTASFTR